MNGRGGGEARDFAHGFDAGVILLAGVFDYVVPQFSAHDFYNVSLFLPSHVSIRIVWSLVEVAFDDGGIGGGGEFGDSFHAIYDDDTIEAFVVSDSVGTVAESESREIELSGEFIGIGDFFGFFDFDDIAGGAAEPHGS